MIKAILISLFAYSVSHASPNAIDQAWQGFSDPEIMASGFTHNYHLLPLKGSMQIGPKAWSGSYWASHKGGINIRWNSPNREGFKYKSPTKAEVEKMSLDQLAQLSATEKYDLFLGDYSYSMRKDAEDTANPRAEDWAGICHGWTPAALHHNEPLPKVMTNPDGIQIPFGSSDIKALLSWYYAFRAKSDEGSHQVGLRCFFGRWMGGARACDEDLNAGAFHIVISNMLGLRQEGFAGDVDRFKEVWNQPIVSYNSKVLEDNLKPSSKAAKKTVKEMLIATELFYVDESDEDTWEPVHGTRQQMISKKDLKYRLELNAEDEIIGGEWVSEERPDFLWNRPKVEKFEGILSGLPLLLND